MQLRNGLGSKRSLRTLAATMFFIVASISSGGMTPAAGQQVQQVSGQAPTSTRFLDMEMTDMIDSWEDPVG